MKEMQDYFNEFWWKLLAIDIGILPHHEGEYHELKNKMIEKEEIKRKVLMTRYVKYVLLKQPKLTEKEKNNEIKVIMLGQGGVGKSSLTTRFTYHFDPYEPTIEDSYRSKSFVDGIGTLFEVFDTCGYYEYSAMRDFHTRIGDCFIIVASLSNRDSLEDIDPFIQNIIRVKDKEVQDFPIIFSLNKVDLLSDNDQKNEIIEDYTNVINTIIKENELVRTKIIISSARTGENVDLLYHECARLWRSVFLQNLKLLEKIIEKDKEYIEELKRIRKDLQKKCLVM